MTETNTTHVESTDPSTGRVEPLSVENAADLCESVERNIGRIIVGNDETIRHVVTTMLAGGHVLLEDVPGVGKTMVGRSLARSIDCRFSRIQFTPDLLPSDITGANVFNQRTREFEFKEGPVFGNVVLGDEINRAPPKTQSALLEAMEETQVTVDGETMALPTPFTVIATQNMVEPNRTYELPFAEVDRFMKKLSLGYPDVAGESEMLERTAAHHPIEDLEPVTDRESILRARETVAEITTRKEVREYAAKLAAFTREHAEIGASPRGTIALVKAAKARAMTERREYVLPDDVKAVAPMVLSHRIKPSSSSPDVDGSAIVEQALSRVSVG